MIKFLGSALLAAGLAVSAGANAATYDLNTLAPGSTSIAELVAPGSFSDTIDFSIGSPSSVSTAAGTSSLSIFGTTVLDISGLTLTVFNSNNVKIGSGLNLNLGTLGTGNYYAVITGTATGSSGGTYGESFKVSPVPEASTWAMMLLGLGFLGFTAKRRKS